MFSPDGTFIRSIGDAGTVSYGWRGLSVENGKFAIPKGIAIGHRMVNDVEISEIYVADQKTQLIQVFDLEGKYLRSMGGRIRKSMGRWRTNGLFNNIQGLEFDQHGNLHVLAAYQDEVQILNPMTGRFINRYGAFLDDKGANIQLDIDISANGQVVITNLATRSAEIIYTVQ